MDNDQEKNAVIEYVKYTYHPNDDVKFRYSPRPFSTFVDVIVYKSERYNIFQKKYIFNYIYSLSLDRIQLIVREMKIKQLTKKKPSKKLKSWLMNFKNS